ncbi:sel1 repeat family protein, partial [Streptomyces sp. TRM76130]|nr:sel1 repeat family protein [Streptomyces sp. TRM76130]
AASAGHAEAALQVGMARLRDGDEQEAERHLRCAAGGGSAEAAYRLAALLDARRPPEPAHELGEPAHEKTECEEWYERAAG